MPGRWTRVLVVDDYELVRLGLRRALERERWFQVVGECAGVAGTAARAGELRPDIALVASRLPDGSSADLVRALRAACPRTRVIVLTDGPGDAELVAAMEAGAVGYTGKRRAAEAIVADVRTVARGLPLMDADLVACTADRLREERSRPARLQHLNDRELQILRLMADGRSNEDVARELGLALKTVKNVATGLFAKLGVSSRTQAAMLYVRLVERP